VILLTNKLSDVFNFDTKDSKVYLVYYAKGN